MKINIKYFGIMDYDLPSEITLEEGSSIKSVADVISLGSTDIDTFTLLLNDEPASYNDVLKDGDTLLILQVLGGG